MIAISIVLFLAVVMTFFMYRSKLTESGARDSRSYTASGQYVAEEFSIELPLPQQITVTIDKGATIKWEEEPDDRIIGYNVYRYQTEDDSGSKVNAAIVSDTVYYDDEGTQFNSYAVAVVDATGEEGPVSQPVAAVLEPSSLDSLLPTRAPEVVEDVTLSDSPPPQSLPPDVVDCAAAGMSFAGVWYLEHYGEVTGGTLMVTPYPGDSVTYTFNGDSVTVIATRHWNYGIMDIYVDGVLRQEVDLYSPEIKVNDRVYTASGLGAGVHTIRLVCTGKKNPAANFTFIDFEALEIK